MVTGVLSRVKRIQLVFVNLICIMSTIFVFSPQRDGTVVAAILPLSKELR